MYTKIEQEEQLVNKKLMLDFGYKVSGEQVRPWVRFWARSIDFLIFIIVFVMLEDIFLTEVVFYQEFLRQIPDFVLNILLSFLYIFMEPILLSTWGTTFGKALLKVRVRNRDGTKLSYNNAFRRTFHLWVFGQGMFIPVILLIAHYKEYRNLIEKHESSWDIDGEHIVTHQIIGTVRVLIVLLPIAFFLSIGFLGE